MIKGLNFLHYVYIHLTVNDNNKLQLLLCAFTRYNKHLNMFIFFIYQKFLVHFATPYVNTLFLSVTFYFLHFPYCFFKISFVNTCFYHWLFTLTSSSFYLFFLYFFSLIPLTYFCLISVSTLLTVSVSYCYVAKYFKS